MSGIPIEAPEDSPGHAGHTPQPWANLGLSLGRLHDLAGGIFGSGIVRAMLDRPQSAGVLGAQPPQDYAAEVFGIPGGMTPGAPKRVPSAKESLAAHANTVLSLEEAGIRYGRSGRTNYTVPQQLKAAIEQARTWTAPR